MAQGWNKKVGAPLGDASGKTPREKKSFPPKQKGPKLLLLGFAEKILLVGGGGGGVSRRKKKKS